MATVDLKKGQIGRHVSRAVKAINEGYVIIVPLENGYAYLCDAFSHDAVRSIHVMRGDESGVKCQVLVRNTKMAEGISRNLDKRTLEVMKKYWPMHLDVHLHYFSQVHVEKIFLKSNMVVSNKIKLWQTLSLGYILNRYVSNQNIKKINMKLFGRLNLRYYVGQSIYILEKNKK